MAYKINEKQISPCITAKARYALGITTIKSSNKKTCSKDYWAVVVTALGKDHNISQGVINQAIAKVELYER